MADCTERLTALGEFTSTQIDALCGEVDTAVSAVSDSLPSDLSLPINVSFLLFGGALVFIMHAGFAMLCAGAVRSKNAMNILLQTVLDAGGSAIMWYLVGFAFAFGYSAENGAHPTRFIGNNQFAAARYMNGYNGATNNGMWTFWFFQWAFAATAATIPAGAVAERFNFNAYLGYTLLVSGLVYPVVVHWAWSPYGWMGYLQYPYGQYYDETGELVGGETKYLFGNAGYIDFAGCGVVHMVGALTGLMGCVLVGPRLGRFDSEGNPVDMPGHNATLVVLGTLLLWFGWYGFNPCSVLLVTAAGYEEIAGRAAVTTTLSAAAGCYTALAWTFFRHKKWDLVSVCNGTLVGLVSITASAHVVEPWAALICGFIGEIIFELVCILFLKLKIDDPLSAVPMHGFGGAWGLIWAGLMAKEKYMVAYYGREGPYGLFYGGGGKLIASQFIGILVITGWVCSITGTFFYVLKLLKWLRISPEEEAAGLDASKHGGSAYNGDPTYGNGEKQIKPVQSNQVAAVVVD